MYHQKLPTRVFLRGTGGCRVTSSRNSTEPTTGYAWWKVKPHVALEERAMAPVPSQATRRPSWACWLVETCFLWSWRRCDKTEHAMAVLVLLTQEPHASSCQMIKIFCFLPSLGASHSGRDYMDAKASCLLGMWANWLQMEASRFNKLLHFESKEPLLTFSLTGDSWGSNLCTYDFVSEGWLYESSDSDMNLLVVLRKYL